MSEDLQLNVSEAAERKAYSTPAIVHELKLETRAGTPLRTDPADPLGIDPTRPQVD